MSYSVASLALALTATVCACARPSPLINYPAEAARRPWQPATTTITPAASVPDPAKQVRVTLPQLLAYADRHAPTIAIALAETTRSEVERVQAELPVPSEPVVRVAAGPRRSGAGTAMDYAASIQQELEVGGQRGLRRQLARRAATTEARRVDEARWQTHLQVHTQYHVAIVERERVTLANRLLAFANRLLDIARKRFKAGDISALHVEVAEGEVALSEQRRTAAVATYRAAQLLLAELSGWPVARPPVPLGKLDVPRPAPSAQVLIARALEQHPSLRVLTATAIEASARMHVADRVAWPNPVVGLSYAVESEVGAAGLDRQHVAMLSLSVPLPLFRNNRPARAQARADLLVARARHAALQRNVHARVHRGVLAVNAAVQRLRSFQREVLPRFEANLVKLTRAFELGEVDVLEVLVARGRFLELQQSALSAYATYFRAIAALEAQLGGDLWPNEPHGEAVTK